MTIEQEKEQAKLCVAWLSTVNMHRLEEQRDELDPNGKRWNKDEAWEEAVEDAEDQEQGADYGYGIGKQQKLVVFCRVGPCCRVGQGYYELYQKVLDLYILKASEHIFTTCFP